MKQKLIFTSFLLFVLMIMPAYAALTADVTILRNSIYLDEQATFKLVITNPEPYSKVIQVYSTDIEFYTEIEPTITKIEPESTITLTLKLLPSVWSNIGAKGVNIMVSSPAVNEQLSFQLPVYIKSYDDPEKKYSPSVELKIEFPKEVDPREEYPINIYLRNRNKLDIKSMELVVKSNAFNPEKIILTLNPYPEGERRENIIYTIDSLTQPMEDILEVGLIIDNVTFNRERIPYKIVAYSEFVKTEETREELFKKTTEYTIINEGNIKSEELFKFPTSVLKRIFVSSTPAPDKINLKQEAYLAWELELEPRQEVKIKVVENYRPLIYILLIFIVITLIYFLYRSPLTIKKETIITGTSTEGISELKVILHIRNRSQDLIEHIKVTDLIPSIAEMIKETNIGTLAPVKIIRNDRKGTIVKWELEALEPFEERIISYRLKSKIAIVGGLTLPPAKIKFETKKGKERTVRSNKSQVSLGF